MINRTLIVLTWIVFAIVYTLTFQLAWDGTTADIPASKVLSAEQQDLHDTLLAEKKKNLPRLAIVQETGEVVYVSADGKWFSETPEWYKDGIISLSDLEMLQVYSLATIDAPLWVFWEDTITLREYESLTAILLTGIVLGLIFGIVLEFMLGIIFGIIFGIVLGLMFELVFGLMFVFSCILLFIFVFWMTLFTRKYWSVPPKNIGTANSA